MLYDLDFSCALISVQVITVTRLFAFLGFRPTGQDQEFVDPVIETGSSEFTTLWVFHQGSGQKKEKRGGAFSLTEEGMGD
jgi:hypothetical protein